MGGVFIDFSLGLSTFTGAALCFMQPEQTQNAEKVHRRINGDQVGVNRRLCIIFPIRERRLGLLGQARLNELHIVVYCV
ncbi:hypothetical protein F5Y07DRAFT_84159 [Xylaria sp. FL0933]|nr:hypothetical protein F5Y07DRAFT_84159 [Xylaria sp. FL0933]